ncbi:MAG: glycosyl hydrolase [Chitinophagaceae bacterium]
MDYLKYILVSALVLLSTVLSAQRNLLKNGSFEDDLESWSANPDIKVSPYVHFEGKNAAVILSLQGTQWVGMDQSVRFPKNTKAVEVGCAVQSLNIKRGPNAWNTGVVILEFQSGKDKIGDNVTLANIEGTQNWKEAKKQVMVPDGASGCRIMVALSQCVGTLYVDNFDLHVISLDSIPGHEPNNPFVPIKHDGKPTHTEAETKKNLTDKNAINQVADLFYNLKQNASSHILLGQQDATKSGVIDSVHAWSNELQNTGISRYRSDIKTLTGQYPAVYGFDFAKATDTGKGNTWFSYEKKMMRELAIDAYNRKGVLTFCWHVRNPVTDSSFYWQRSPVEAVSQILPGGLFNGKFKSMLKSLADFDKTLVDRNGQWIPIIFRPWHEMDGNWFWWGAGHCTPEQFKVLYRYTAKYLTDTLGVHNMLFAWSPDRGFSNEKEYMAFYPGDDVVDLVGMDQYEDMKPQHPIDAAINKIKIVSDYAQGHNKLAAITETGLQGVPDSSWFTQRLLKVLTANKLPLSYVLIWANTPWAYWIPYKGHPAEKNFVEFTKHPYIALGSNMPNLYQPPN